MLHEKKYRQKKTEIWNHLLGTELGMLSRAVYDILKVHAADSVFKTKWFRVEKIRLRLSMYNEYLYLQDEEFLVEDENVAFVVTPEISFIS